MLTRSVLITGCSRGLGLELVRQLVPQTEIIIATCRSPANATELMSLASQFQNVKILKLDVLQSETFDQVADQVSALVGEKGLNLLINNAGILSQKSKTEPFFTEEMAEIYAMNVIAPVKVTKSLLPLLQSAGRADAGHRFRIRNALVVNISSVYGSINEASTALYLPYRCSKAALNMATKSLSCELKSSNISVISLHPGSVQTDMGGPKAPLTKEESIASMLQVLRHLRPEETGQFFNWKGEKLPW